MSRYLNLDSCLDLILELTCDVVSCLESSMSLSVDSVAVDN